MNAIRKVKIANGWVSCVRDARDGRQNFRGLHEGDAPFWRARGKAYTLWHICTLVANVTYLSRVFTYRIDARRGRTFIPPTLSLSLSSPCRSSRSSSFGADRRGV